MSTATDLLVNNTHTLLVNDDDTFSVNDADMPALRNAIAKLADAGYCETVISKRLGLADLTELQWRAVPVYRKVQLAVRDKLASAIDLFFLQSTIPMDELNQLFDENDRDLLVRAGLLSIDEKGFVCARASLFPVGNYLIFSDHAWPMLPNPGYAKVPYNQVMFIGCDSRWLAHATIRHPVGAALDLCTGSGIHALLAAAHSERVCAVDINPRAVRCARLNAQISEATNITTLLGDLYEPVRGERFDLITANPPFVPAPVNTIMFRDGGCSGEEVQRRIVAGLPEHLAPGGMAQIVTELGEREGESLSDRLRAWLNGAPMDIYILRLSVRSAADYAIGHSEGDTYGAFLSSVEEWTDNIRAQGYARIVSVLLAFQWSNPQLGPPWTSSEESLPPNKYVGAEMEEALKAESMARNPKFPEILGRCQIQRAPVGLTESRVLGVNLGLNVQAKLFGKSLSNIQRLEPIEREILLRLDTPMTFSELIPKLNFGKDAILNAVTSLVRRKLILLTQNP